MSRLTALFSSLHRRWRAYSLRRRIALSAAALLLIALGGFWAWLTWDLPSIDRIDAGLALPSTRIYDRHGRLLYEIIPQAETGGRNTVIPLADIPLACRQAVIATEDLNYYAHPGIDVIGIIRAAWINLQGGETLAGGSTITQQVARILLLDPEQRAERTLRRKLREMILAVQLAARYSKDDVLALYLNQAYFGNLAYGIQAAARAYFGIDASALSLAQCALLTGLLQSPARYDPLTAPEAAAERQAVVLRLMRDAGFITADQMARAQAEDLAFASVRFPIEAPHFVMAVIRQLERDYGEAMRTRGLVVTTTLDLDWQRAGETIIRRQLDALNHPPPGRAPANAHNAALVALDPLTGQILTLIGSPDYFDESIDGAVNAALAPRQPGSALKPFTYAAAFDPTRPDPWTPATMVLDVETPFVTRRLESYTPANFGLVEHGPVSVREALASSFNIPAVIALDHIGVPALVELATNAGITTLARNPNLDLAVTLGGGEVRLLDLTAAYGIFATGGYRVQPAYLLRVETADGQPLYEWRPPTERLRVIDERVAYLITDILSDDAARIPGFGRNSALNIGQPAAAKTGTTTDFRDNWIVGYTPDLIVGVWVGNADNTPMQGVTGVSGAAPIWNRFMRAALAGRPEQNFTMPPGIIRMDVCSPSGLLPTPQCQRIRTEVFIEGTQPTTYDSMYQVIAIDRETGLIADDLTPIERRVAQTFLIVPPEARDWALRNGVPQPPAGRARVTETARVRLLDPDPYTVFEISPLIPLEVQRLRFTADAAAGVVSVTYRLDSGSDTQILGTVSERPFALWWTLAPGSYRLTAEAVFADGTRATSESIPFRVALPDPFPPPPPAPGTSGSRG
jgi:penicillin-binding protein 1C